MVRGDRFFYLFFAFWGLISAGMFDSVAWGQVKITKIDFKGTGDPSEIVIEGNAPLTYEKQDNTQDKQMILEFSGATISKGAAQKIDTSSFNSQVSLISPYQVSGKKDVVRVVVQMRDAVSVDVAQDGNKVSIKVPVAGAAGASSGGSPSAEAPPPPGLPQDPVAQQQAPQAQTQIPAVQDAPKGNLDSFADSHVTQKFTGKPITLQVRDADVLDLLRMIGEASGFNVIIGEDVKGKMTLALEDVPWDQALDVILQTLQLGAERKGSILRVVTLSRFLQEKEQQRRAEIAAAAVTPKVTRIFPISYANLTDLQKVLSQFAASRSGPGDGGANPDAPIVQADARTNSLIVRDVPDGIEKMKKLIEILDTQTPQVMIEARIVEATEGFSKTLSGSLGVGGTGSTAFVASTAGGDPASPLMGTPGVFKDGAAVGAASAKGGTFGLSPDLSFIPGVSKLNAILNWGESENQVKIVSSPKTVVLNKESATIVQGTPVLVPGTTTVNGVGTVPTTTVQQANVSLKVTPTVTNEGSVLLKLDVSKDVPFGLGNGNSGIGNRNMNTQVLVDSGSTLVIGGIYSLEETAQSAGFPFLRKIPLLGALFGSDSQSSNRSEIFFFVTPRILNVKEAGLVNT